MTDVLVAAEASVRFGGVRALDSVNLAVPDNHPAGLIGPNGVEQRVHLALEVADRRYVLAHGDVALGDRAVALRTNSALLVSSYPGDGAG